MSKFNPLKKYIFPSLIFLLVAGLTYTQATSKKLRNPSSTGKQALINQNLAQAPVIRHTKKISSGIQTSITNEYPEQIEAGDVFELTGKVLSPQRLPQLEVQWILPKGITIISGEKQQIISDIRPGKVYEFSLSARSEDDNNQVIHLKASSSVGKMRFSHLSQYNTVNQESIDKGRKELSEMNSSYIKSNKAQ